MTPNCNNYKNAQKCALRTQCVENNRKFNVRRIIDESLRKKKTAGNVFLARCKFEKKTFSRQKMT